MLDALLSVKDKIIVITGGLGQLGQQFSRALINQGAKVVILDIRNKIPSVKSSLEGKSNLLILRADITKADSLRRALKRINKTFGIPYGLINNASLDSPPNTSSEANGPFESYCEEVWDKVMEVNLKGALLSSQIIGAQMAQARRGSIINISSVYGMVSPDQRIYEYLRSKGKMFFKPVAYSVSKAGLLNFTRYLATYWAPKGVRVNTLTLGGVFNKQDKRFIRAYCDRVPLRRMARDDEYSSAVIFLLSDASSYMTGSNMVIDGGWTAW